MFICKLTCSLDPIHTYVPTHLQYVHRTSRFPIQKELQRLMHTVLLNSLIVNLFHVNELAML